MKNILRMTALAVLFNICFFPLPVSAGQSNITAFVNSDGEIDIEALRMSGYEGAIDLNNPNARIDNDRQPDDEYWEGDFRYPGVSGNVNAMAVYNGQLIIGGRFYAANGTPAANVAAWDGTTWTPLVTSMTDSASYSEVYAFIEFDNKLIMGGRFDTIDGVPMNCVAAWDGSHWSPLGNGLDGHFGVTCFAVYKSQLVAGGVFSNPGTYSANIAVWTGSYWSTLGTGLDGPVEALLADGDDLIVGGGFSTGDGIAYWNAGGWNTFGSGVNGHVEDVIIYNDQLVIAGYFDSVGTVPANNIASWTGSSWVPLGEGTNYRIVELAVHENLLVAGGDFTTAGGDSALKMAVWNGSSWSQLGTGTNGRVETFCDYENQLYAGGAFSEAGMTDAPHIAVLKGGDWSKLGMATGVGAGVNTLAAYDNKLIVGGNFLSAGDIRNANYIAAWDDGWWTPLGQGFNGPVTRLILYGDDLIAAGDFTVADGNDVNKVALWNGNIWSSLGSGVIGSVYDLTVFDDQLIMAGQFDTVGGNEATNIAAWDGNSWSAVGPSDIEAVYSVAVYDGQLMALGGLPAYWVGSWNPPEEVPVLYPGQTEMLSWDGNAWTVEVSKSEWDPSPQYCMAVYDNKLYIGGISDSIGGVEVNGVAVWDGSLWSALEPVSDESVNIYAFHIFDNRLIVGGRFSSTDGLEIHNIASWDGSSWFPLGSGTNSSVYALAEYYDRLFVGGFFNIAGDKITQYLAAWNPYGITCCHTPGDADNDGQVNIGDAVRIISYVFKQGDAPPCLDEGDASADGAVNVGDAVHLINYIFKGGPEPTCPGI